ARREPPPPPAPVAARRACPDPALAVRRDRAVPREATRRSLPDRRSSARGAPPGTRRGIGEARRRRHGRAPGPPLGRGAVSPGPIRLVGRGWGRARGRWTLAGPWSGVRRQRRGVRAQRAPLHRPARRPGGVRTAGGPPQWGRRADLLTALDALDPQLLTRARGAVLGLVVGNQLG